MKRNPEKMLNSLTQHSSDLEYKFERLYRILFNDEMYYIAYQHIYAKQGNMTKGVDGETVDGFSVSHIEQLIDTLKNETYQPKPSQRVYIPKKNGEEEAALGIPSFMDKLLQEVVRMILEAIYEGSFEYTSHGFRPQRSPQTALSSIQRSFNGTKWFIEGDIKGFFDHINHEILIAILSERISDERFLRLIRKFLNAGYMEDQVFHKSYSGTPQGGIISPILANIYLDKFDKYIKAYIKHFNKGKRRKENPIVKRLGQRKAKLVAELRNTVDETTRQLLLAKIRGIVKERLNYPAADEMDDSIKRLKYIRYADDFLIGVIGSKQDCIQIKEDIKQFMADKLKLELSDEKTLITHARKHAKFLGYDVFVRKSNDTRRDKNGHLTRSLDHKIVLYVTTETMRRKLLEYDAVKIVRQNGKEVWKPKGRSYMRCLDDLEIISQYNAEIMGFYNYYSIANNSPVIDSFYHIMEYRLICIRHTPPNTLPQNKAALDSIRVSSDESPAQKRSAIDPEKVDWKELERLGVSREKLETSGNLDRLLNWQKTGLISLAVPFGDTTIYTEARLALRTGADGRLSLNIHTLRREPQLDFPYMGHTFSPEEKEQLLTQGNFGKTVELTPKKGEPFRAYVSVDRLTNELVSLRADRVQIPHEIKGVRLSGEQHRALTEGRPVQAEGMLSRHGKPFDATLQVNAEKRGIEFIFKDTLSNKERLKSSAKEAPAVRKTENKPQKRRIGR